MVKIVIPLHIEAVASSGWRMDDTHVVQIAFSDHPNSPTQFLCLLLNSLPDVVQDVSGTEIEDAVDGVDSKTIHMIFRHPVEGVIDDKPIRIESTIDRGHWQRIIASASEEWGGMGALAPETIVSGGSEVILALNAYAFALYKKVREL